MEQSGAFAKRIAEKTDKELIEMAGASAGQLSERTMELVRAEIERRGGYATLHRNVLGTDPLPDDPQRVHNETAPVVQVAVEALETTVQPLKRVGGTRVLKEESILSQWSTLVQGGGKYGEWVLVTTCKQLKDAQLPRGCNWAMQEVRSSGLLQRVYREFLVVSWDQFPDHRIYVGVRDFGIHLYCCWYLAVEPDLITKWVSKKLTGLPLELSAPKNIMVDQDLSLWASVVHHALLDTIHELLQRLGKDMTTVHQGSKGFLEVW